MLSRLFGRNKEVEALKVEIEELNEQLGDAREANDDLKALEESAKQLAAERLSELNAAKGRIAELEAQLEEANNSKPVTYASQRKVMTKAKLKALRAQLEAVPSGAQGFGGTVSVYDKKTKRLSTVQLKSKEQALEILEKAEKGNVDIVI